MSMLADIAAYKKREIAAAKKNVPLAEAEEDARNAPAPRGFIRALTAARPALIAEIKHKSPSKGLIRADFNPAEAARAYEAGGATCLSVLTDAPSFGGAPEHLMQARTAAKLPILRKDFMLDVYQVAEARSWGADAILIIMGLVDDATAAALAEAADKWSMDALFEVHDEAELKRALALSPRLIGINNRNLRSFETSLDTTLDLIPHVPHDIPIVSESGIANSDDIRRLSEAGVHAFLVGESLMRQPDLTAATRDLLG